MGKIELTRRKFLIGTGATLLAAPAIVQIANLMPVRVHDLDQWYHVVYAADGGEVRTFIDGVHITKSITRYTGLFTPPDVSYPDWTFEAWVKNTNKDTAIDNVRLSKGDRYSHFKMS